MKNFPSGPRRSQTTRGSFRITAALLPLAAAIMFVVLGCSTDTGKAAALPITAAQQTNSGEWTAQFERNRQGSLQMSFIRDTSSWSVTIPASELQGLPADAATLSNSTVNFRIVREAGTFDCQGYFNAGKGAGHWTFQSNPAFVTSMRSYGYTNLTDEDLLHAAIHNLTAKYIDTMKAAGYDKLDFETVSRAAGHEITPAYIAELRAAGFGDLPMEQVIRAHNHDVDGKMVSEIKTMGLRAASLDQVIRLTNHAITSEYVNGLKAEGLSDLSVDTVIRLKNHDVDSNFIRRARSQGYNGLSADELIRLHNRGEVK